MRVLILLALIGGLAWYGWTAYGTDEEATRPDTEVAEVHRMIPVAPRPNVTDVEDDATRDEPLRSPSPSNTLPGSKSQPGASPQPGSIPPPAPEALSEVKQGHSAPASAADGGYPSDGGLQLDLGARRTELAAQGRMMLHDLEGVQRLLAADSGLSDERRQLLYALASVVIGQLEAASNALELLADAREVTSEELAFLRSAVSQGSRARAAGAGLQSNPLLLGTRLGVLQREADEARFAEDFRAAAEGYSELLREELRAPWEADQAALAAWAQHLGIAQAQHRWNRRGDWPSFEVRVLPGDSLTVIRKRIIAERPGTLICTGLIAAVNQTGQYLQPDDILRIPLDQARAEVYIGARWVLYLHGDEVLAAWPCAVGRAGHETPPGKYRAGVKQEEPAWMRDGYDPVPYGDPENPLGTRWIAWDGRKGFGFHGTWEPETVGTAASDGCIRLRNEDVERLFEILPKGAEIDVRP